MQTKEQAFEKLARSKFRMRFHLGEKDLKYIDVLPAEYMQRLGALLELPGFSKDAAPNVGFSFSEEMLV